MEVVEGDPSTAPPATPPTHVASSSDAYSATMKTQLAEKATVDAPASRQSVNAATEPIIKEVKAVNAVNPVNATPVVKAAVKAVSVDVLYDENLLEHTGGLPVFMDDTTRVWLERALSNDTKFLCDTRIMDYSLLVRSVTSIYYTKEVLMDTSVLMIDRILRRL